MKGFETLCELFEGLKGEHLPKQRIEDAHASRMENRLPAIDRCDGPSGDCS